MWRRLAGRVAGGASDLKFAAALHFYYRLPQDEIDTCAAVERGFPCFGWFVHNPDSLAGDGQDNLQSIDPVQHRVKISRVPSLGTT